MRIVLGLLAVLLVLVACGGESVTERTLKADDHQGVIVMGVMEGRHTAFKEQVAQTLFEKLDRRYDIVLTNVGGVDLPQADAYVIVDALWAGGKMNGKVKSTLDSLPQEKTVLFITAGDPEAEFIYNGLDAVTSASEDPLVDERAEEIAAKLRTILQR